MKPHEPTLKSDLAFAFGLIAAALMLLVAAWWTLTPRSDPPPRSPDGTQLPITKGFLVPLAPDRDQNMGCVAWKPDRQSDWRLLCMEGVVYGGPLPGDE